MTWSVKFDGELAHSDIAVACTSHLRKSLARRRDLVRTCRVVEIWRVVASATCNVAAAIVLGFVSTTVSTERTTRVALRRGRSRELIRTDHHPRVQSGDTPIRLLFL